MDFAANFENILDIKNDGNTWAATGTGFPTGSSRIGLGVQSDNPNVLYALVANTNATNPTSKSLLGVYRLDNETGPWINISGAPSDIFGSQGSYDLAITIDPNNAIQSTLQAANMTREIIFIMKVISIVGRYLLPELVAIL
jgi:hypothetical protein